MWKVFITDSECIQGRKYSVVYEKVTALANKVSTKRSDAIVLNRRKNSGLAIDPNIKFHNCKEQTKLFYEEKQNIYIFKQFIIIQRNSSF